MNLKHAPYSVSKIKTFDECPRKFHEYYVLKNRPIEEPKPFFEKGKFFHWILEHYPNFPEKKFKFKLATKDMITEWKEIARQFMSSELVKQLIANKQHSEFEFGLHLMDGNLIPGSGKREDQPAFRGYIDLITSFGSNAALIDWKSGKSVADDLFQLETYALWFLKSNPELDVDVSYVRLENLPATAFHHLTQSDAHDIERSLINKMMKIEKEDFHRKPNRNCNYCQYFFECKPFEYRRI